MKKSSIRHRHLQVFTKLNWLHQYQPSVQPFPNNNDCYSSFSIFTDYLLGQANTTLNYKCIQPVSDSLPVTLSDFDGNTVIQLYNMRSGNDQNIYRVHGEGLDIL